MGGLDEDWMAGDLPQHDEQAGRGYNNTIQQGLPLGSVENLHWPVSVARKWAIEGVPGLLGVLGVLALADSIRMRSGQRDVTAVGRSA
jgi:hypothetical protein